MAKTLSLISGKGGTGKTIISTSIVSSIQGVVVIDGDVQSPNLNVILRAENITESFLESGNSLVEISNECDGCGKCLEVCRYHAIELNQGRNKAIILKNFCIGCEVCSYVCPVDAIYMVKREPVKIKIGETRFGKLIFSEPVPGERITGRLVSELRKKAEDVARLEKLDYIIIDGSPGAGCHVIAAITDVEIPIIVIEPTIAAREDLKRMINLLKYFNLNGYVILNKSDLNDKVRMEIREICKDNQVEVISEIPFLPDVFKVINSGKTPMEYEAPEIKSKFKELTNKIKEILKS